MTITVAWVTDTWTLQPIIEHAIARLNAHLVMVSEPAAMPTDPVDLLIWSPLQLDRARYEEIRPRCFHMVICIPKGMEVPRWYPRYDLRWPSYWALTPLDADEFAIILEYALRGPTLARLESERDDTSAL